MSANDYQEIIYEVSDPVAVITMNRPEALNAFTARMLAEIRHALRPQNKMTALLASF